MKRLAAAFALLATPVHANDCNVVSQAIPYFGVVIHQTANVKDHSYCVSFEPKDPRVDSVSPSLEKPTCIDVNGDPEQAIVPLLYMKQGGVVTMEIMQTPEAKKIYDMMIETCNRPEGTPTGFKAIPQTTKELKL